MALVSQLRDSLAARFDLPVGIIERPQIQFPTGISALDRLTSGGIPRGTLTEISGPASSGRTSVLFSLLARATQNGECCALIDASGSFDPFSAAHAGADLDRILWINCSGNAENALKATDLLIQAGGFGLVILDLADTPEREAARIPLASWFRLRHAAERSGTALLLAATRINARSCSTLQIELKRKHPLWSGHLLRGLLSEASSRKNYRAAAAEFDVVR